MSCNLGKDGVVKVGTTAVGHVRSWTIDETVDQLETTAMGDAYKTRCLALKDWSGSMDVLWDTADAGQTALVVGATVNITVYPVGETGDSLTGSVVITGVSTNASYDGLVEASVSFQGNGALTRS